MRLSAICENINDLIMKISISTDKTPEEVRSIILSYNPPNGKYADFIAKLWNNNNIRLPEDGTRLKQALTNFKKYQSRLQVKDINQYKSLHQLETVLEPFHGTTSKRSGGLGFNPLTLPGVTKVNQVGEYYTVEVTDPDSLAKLGEGTKWCTRASYGEDCQAEYYINKYGSIFTIFKGDKPFVQYTPDYDQVMNKNDEPIDPHKLINIIPKPPYDSEYAYYYARIVLDNRWLEAEPIIAKNPPNACDYAKYVIEGRWPEAEPYIAQNPMTACDYARYIIKGRWPEAEPYIMQDPEMAYLYAKDALEDRWPEAEPYIMQNDRIAQSYKRAFKLQ